MSLLHLVQLLAVTVATVNFPASWGQPPNIQTSESDNLMLPGGYGMGSSVVAAWITLKMADDREAGNIQYPPAWGQRPAMQVRGPRELPLGYGQGSGTLLEWIKSAHRRTVFKFALPAQERTN
jgi:hypothetical protein